jgi:hypothetical protein
MEEAGIIPAAGIVQVMMVTIEAVKSAIIIIGLPKPAEQVGAELEWQTLIQTIVEHGHVLAKMNLDLISIGKRTELIVGAQTVIFGNRAAGPVGLVPGIATGMVAVTGAVGRFMAVFMQGILVI